MPVYGYDKDYPFAAFVTNLGKYNEGELVGEWVKFPTTAEEMKKVFDRIGIGQTDDFGHRYEEWFITDYDCYVDGLYDKLGEYESLDELNYLASKLDEMSQGEYEQFQAAMEIGDHSGSVQEIINLTENLDCYDVYPDIENYDDLGRYYIDELDAMQVPEHLKNYIDYEAYGRDVAMEEGGDFTDLGYVRDTGDRFEEVYDGGHDSIPEEYRVMTFLDEQAAEEEIGLAMSIAYDMDEYFRQNDPQYAAEHPDAHAAKEEIYEILETGRIDALEGRLAAIEAEVPRNLSAKLEQLSTMLEEFKASVEYGKFPGADLADAPKQAQAVQREPDAETDILDTAVELAMDADLFLRQTSPGYVHMYPYPHDQEQREKIADQLLAGDYGDLKKWLIIAEKSQEAYAPAAKELLDRVQSFDDRFIGKDDRMMTVSMELAGDIDLFFRQHDMEYAAMFPDDTVQQIALHEHLYRGDTSDIKTGLINVGREKDLTEETAPLIGRLDAYEKEFGINTYMVYQLQGGDKTLDFRFEPLDAIRRNGLSVDPANYELVYAASFTPGETLETIYRDMNVDRPENFHGHSLSVSDVVVLREYGKDTAHYCDRFGFSQVPEFLEPERAKEVTILTPDQMTTQERISTPRGSFCVTDMTREQMEKAGYGVHHQSDDGKYLIMGNGTRAFAVLAEQPEKDNPLRTAEMTLEDDYGMIDGVINNGRRGEEVEKAKEAAEKGEPEKKPSIRERLEDARRECSERKPPEKGRPGREAPEHGDL